MAKCSSVHVCVWLLWRGVWLASEIVWGSWPRALSSQHPLPLWSQDCVCSPWHTWWMAQHAWYTPLGLPVLNPPLSPTFFRGSKANSAANGIGFQFFHRIFVIAFYEPLMTPLKNHLKKKNRAIPILSFEFKRQLLFDLQVCSQIPGGVQDPSRGSTRQKWCSWYYWIVLCHFHLADLRWWHRAAAGRTAGTHIGTKARLATAPAVSASLFLSATVPAQHQKRRKGRFCPW